MKTCMLNDKDLLQEMPVCVCWKDLDGMYCGCNFQMTESFCLISEDNIKNKTNFDLFKNDSAVVMSNIEQQVIATKNEHTDDYVLTLLNGKQITCLIKHKPLIDNYDNIYGILIVIMNINDISLKIKSQLDTAIQNEYSLNSIISSVSGNIYWMDQDGFMLGCNDNQIRTLGLDSKIDFIGKHYSELLPKDNIQLVDVINKQVMLSKERYFNEEIGFDEKGNKAIYLSEKRPLFNAENEVIGLIGLSIDITERKRAEQLEVQRKIIEEKLKVSQNLAGVMAHELRTPIATFKLYADLIKSLIQNPDLSIEEKESRILELVAKCDEVEKSSTQFIDMILYRLRSTNNRLDPERFKVCLIYDDVEDVLDTYAFGLGERELITLKTAKAFPYTGDSVATKHILSNLIKNTLKIIKEEDKGKITISFDQSDEKYNKMIFEDDAKGIDEKFLPLIFDSFVYKDSSGKGTGLGLAFCKMIMVDYGGDIICESELGKYTRFTCLFPKVDMSEFDIP